MKLVRNLTGALCALPAFAVRLLLHGYRFAVSPMLVAMFGRACRFEPSCSAYALSAIEKHGLISGGVMAVRRLLRCHPLGGHGYDPVPAPIAEKR